MNSSLKLFTQPDLLLQLNRESWQALFSHFAASDPQFSPLNLNSPYFASELARIFAQVQSLSPQLRETLLLLESAASPENSARLSAIAQQRFPNLCISEFHPLALALELWLAFPDDLTQFHPSSPALRSASDEGGSSSSLLVAESEPVNSSAPIHQSTTPLSSIEHPASAPPALHSAFDEGGSPIEIQNGRTSLADGRTSFVSSLLNGITSLVTRYAILPKHAAEALALWIIHTYAFELRDVTTYLALESPVRRCGKTTLLNILSRLVNRPLVAANVSPPALYRAIEELRPTLMIDEADTFLKPNDELIGILNAG
jgi:hypothetical protein